MHSSSYGTRYMLFAFLTLILTAEPFANEAIAFDFKIKRGLQSNSSVPSLSLRPSVTPSNKPSFLPSDSPRNKPSPSPSLLASAEPSLTPSTMPSPLVSDEPSLPPSNNPSSQLSNEPSTSPSITGSDSPSSESSLGPSSSPSISTKPSGLPSSTPSISSTPTIAESGLPSLESSSAPSTSSIPSAIPTSTTSPSLSPSISSMPSIFPSILPTSTPSGPVPSTSPSSTPTFGEKTVTTPFIIMDLIGLEEKLFSSRAIDHWRGKVTNFTKDYWDEQENVTFVFSDLVSHIETQEFFVPSARRLVNANVSKRNLRGPFSLRIIFTQEYTFRGSADSTVPKDTYFVPLSKPEFLTFLKADDGTTTQQFQRITFISLKEFVDSGSVSPSPSQAPSLFPTVIDPKHNGESGSFKATQTFLIAFSSITGTIALYLCLSRSLCRKKNVIDEIEDVDVTAVVTVVGGNVTTPTVGNKSRVAKENEEIVATQNDSLAKNSLAFVDESISTLGSQEVVSPGKIDLSLVTAGSKDEEADEEDPQFSVNENDSEMSESDSMLSFDVYSNASEDEGSNESRPNRIPKSEEDAKKNTSQMTNLVVSGAQLSPSKEDGPTIGSTKIIEGKGELKGVKLLAVGDIDDDGFPSSTFPA